MTTNHPAQDSASQSETAPDVSERGRVQDSIQEASAPPAASDAMHGPHGHPLAGLFHRMGRLVDSLVSVNEGSDLEARLGALRQETLWVSEILDTWRAATLPDHGAGLPNLVPVDLQRLAREKVDAWSGPAALKGIKLRFEAQPVREVTGELGMIERLLKALMAVALLATEPSSELRVGIGDSDGGVTWRIGLIGKSGDQAAEGSPTDDPASSAVADLGGTLDLLRPLVEEHSGSLSFEGRPNGLFEIVLSLPPAQVEDATAEGTVLIVDDDPDGAFLLEQVLLKAGFHVRIAGNGLEGLSLARQKGVSLVLLDVMLPGLDGYEVCHRLREDPATAHTPIVMISAKSRPEDREMGLRVGANAYMTKPLGMNDVIQTVTRFMTHTEEGIDDR